MISVVRRFSLVLFIALAVTACASVPQPQSSLTSQFQESDRVIAGFDVDAVTDAPLDIIIAVKLDAPRDDVWALVGDHFRVKEWVPHMSESRLLEEVSTNREFPIVATRQCVLHATGLTMTVVDDIVFENDFAYGYSINRQRSKGPKPVRDHLGVFTAEETSDGGTLLTWRQYWRKGITGQVAAPYMRRRFMEPAINNLIALFGGERVDISD